MGFFNKIKTKYITLEDKYKLNTQNKAEKKAKELEEKAKYANDLNKKLQRQEKAKKQILDLKQKQQKQRAEKLKSVTNFFGSVKNNMDSKPAFMADKKQNDTLFFMENNGNKKKKDILDQFL